MNNENYTAIFIGGEFDLTKRVLRFKEEVISFHTHTPEIPLYSSNLNRESKIKINELAYRLRGETESGVLIYESEGSREA